MKEPGQLLARLDVSTRAWHAQLDGVWAQLLTAEVSISDYSSRLIRTYGLVAPFEAACRYTRGIEDFVSRRPLTRSGLIARDLLVLGLRPQEVSNLPSCPAITSYGSLAELLGWLYVVDRSAQMHGTVRRHLIARLPQVERASSYLAAHEGDDPMVIAKLFDRAGSSHADQVVAAAHAAFATATTWFTGFRRDAQRTG